MSIPLFNGDGGWFKDHFKERRSSGPRNYGPVSSQLRASLQAATVTPAEIDLLEFVPPDCRGHCADCLRRWAVYGDLITKLFASILVSPYIPGDTRKIGSDRIARVAWERFLSYPADNSAAPFDLRAVRHVRPDLLYRIDLPVCGEAKSDWLFKSGWSPSQAKGEAQ